jgi:hypothetical protein
MEEVLMQVIIGPWPLRPHRQWFAAADGTFYRNCSLIMDERKAAIRRGRWRLARKLGEEWAVVFGQGLNRKARLDRGDMVVQQAAFRDAYPDQPGLWVLDEDQPARPGEDALLRYAREHVTSPGAHALLDEVERGRARRLQPPREVVHDAIVGLESPEPLHRADCEDGPETSP